MRVTSSPVACRRCLSIRPPDAQYYALQTRSVLIKMAKTLIHVPKTLRPGMERAPPRERAMGGRKEEVGGEAARLPVAGGVRPPTTDCRLPTTEL